METCRTCHRNHSQEQPCSRRIARALMMRPNAPEELAQTDVNWLSTHKINVEDILEEELANLM